MNQVAMAREQRGLSRDQLAHAVGVTPDTIAYIEQGSYAPSVQLALRMSRVLETPVEQLFLLSPDDHPKALKRRRLLPAGLRRPVLLTINFACIAFAACVVAGRLSNWTVGIGLAAVLLSALPHVWLSRRIPLSREYGLDERESARRMGMYRRVYPLAGALFGLACIAWFLATREDIAFRWMFGWFAVHSLLDSVIDTATFWPEPSAATAAPAGSRALAGPWPETPGSTAGTSR